MKISFYLTWFVAIALANAGCGNASSPDAAPSATSPSTPPTPAPASTSSQIEHAYFRSDTLGREVGITVYLPPGYKEEALARYPVVYLFYGYGGNRDAWFSGLHLDQTADRLIRDGTIRPLIIVCPDYGNSFGVNTAPGEGIDPGGVDIGPYEDYFIQEVIPYVDANYRTDAVKAGRSIGGASMGGFASLHLGFRHPELFGKIGAHSAAIWDGTSSDLYTDQRDWLYPSETLRDARDPFRLAKKSELSDVRVYLDAGADDPLTRVDYALYEQLRDRNIDALWVPNAGGHDPSYWSGQLSNYLRFYADAMANESD